MGWGWVGVRVRVRDVAAHGAQPLPRATRVHRAVRDLVRVRVRVRVKG